MRDFSFRTQLCVSNAFLSLDTQHAAFHCYLAKLGLGLLILGQRLNLGAKCKYGQEIRRRVGVSRKGADLFSCTVSWFHTSNSSRCYRFPFVVCCCRITGPGTSIFDILYLQPVNLRPTFSGLGCWVLNRFI